MTVCVCLRANRRNSTLKDRLYHAAPTRPTRSASTCWLAGIFEVVHPRLISAELASALALPESFRNFGQRTTAVTRFSPTEIMP
jgi:hypothetical protein